jgi:hypothetical protein
MLATRGIASLLDGPFAEKPAIAGVYSRTEDYVLGVNHVLHDVGLQDACAYRIRL